MTQIDRPAGLPDVAAIATSIGEVAYEWHIDSDALSWSANAAAVLSVDPAAMASGRAFAQYVEADSGQSRADLIGTAQIVPLAAGTPYQLEYAFKRNGADPLWLEDSGRWFVGTDGRPLKAQGIVRVINERHERERKLVQAARFDAVTGVMNRNYLTEVLTATIGDAVRYRSSCGFLMVAIDRLGRINEAYGFDVAEEVIAKVTPRLRARLRGKDHLGRFAGNKFGVILTQCTFDELGVTAERLLAGVRDETITTSAGE